MIHRNIAILAFGLLSGRAEGHGHHHHGHHHDHGSAEELHRQLTGVTRCGTPTPNAAEKLQAQKAINYHDTIFGTPSNFKEQTIVIQTYWHNIRTSLGTGGATNQMITDSMIVLNEAYSSQGFSFELVGQTTTDNDAYYSAYHGEQADFDMKSELRQGGRDTLNIYSNGLDQVSGILGYATFPWDYDGFPILDGVVIGSETAPGGSTTNFNEGDTLVHEVGHWLGLWHVFQDGCLYV